MANFYAISVAPQIAAVKAVVDAILPAVVSTSSGTSTGAIVEDTNTGTPKTVAVSSHLNDNTFGEWAEIDASVSDDSWICSVTVFEVGISATSRKCLEIGTGAALSEVPIIRHSFNIDSATDAGYKISTVFILPIPIKVALGTRISARISDTQGGVVAYQVSAQYYQGLEI